MPERRAPETYGGLCRFLSSCPDVTLSEEFKKKDMETFERYIGGVEQTEGKNDEAEKTVNGNTSGIM